MKKIIATALALLLLAGCGGQNGSSSSPSNGGGEKQSWAELRRGLPTGAQDAKALPTPALGDERSMAGAVYIASALALYPAYGGGAEEIAELSEDYLRGVALHLTAGTTVGGPGAGGSGVLELDRLLGHPRRFITLEQVQQVLYDYFDLDYEVEHKSFPPGAAEGEQYTYREDYGVYLYPASPPLPWLPVVTDCRALPGGSYEYLLVFLQQADSEGLSYTAPDGDVIAEWDVYDHVNEHPGIYDWYLVTLAQTASGGFILDKVDRL